MTARGPGIPRSLAGRATGERGSLLAALVATLAVGSILMTVATTQWSFIIRREKEKELVFRGTAIARAIQEFQRLGRAPTTLEEMTKTRPPVLRQILPDPMTARYDREGKLIEGTGEWTFISVGQPGATGGLPGGPPAPPPSGSRPDRGPAITAFVGVRSKSEELSIGTFRDSEPGVPYSEWRFQVLTADAANLMQHVGGFDAIYPPGFAGLRAPGGPPFTGGAAGGSRRSPAQQQGTQPPR